MSDFEDDVIDESDHDDLHSGPPLVSRLLSAVENDGGTHRRLSAPNLGIETSLAAMAEAIAAGTANFRHRDDLELVLVACGGLDSETAKEQAAHAYELMQKTAAKEEDIAKRDQDPDALSHSDHVLLQDFIDAACTQVTLSELRDPSDEVFSSLETLGKKFLSATEEPPLRSSQNDVADALGEEGVSERNAKDAAADIFKVMQKLVADGHRKFEAK